MFSLFSFWVNEQYLLLAEDYCLVRMYYKPIKNTFEDMSVNFFCLNSRLCIMIPVY